jgi:7TMR-DISM extracellular protein 2/7TM protein involved in diverse intracellular signaling
MRLLLFCWCCLILVLTSSALAAPLLLKEQPSYIPQMEYLEDRSGSLRIHNFMATPSSYSWTKLAAGDVNLGYSSSVYWFKFSVRNELNHPQNRLIDVNNPLLNYLSYYRITDNKLVEDMLVGDHFPMTDREFYHSHFLFNLMLDPLEQSDIYFRVSHTGGVQVPITVWNTHAFYENASKVAQLYAVYYGMMSIIILFNLFIFARLRERVYLYYVLFTLSTVLFLASFKGKAYEFLWPQSPWLNDISILLAIPLTVLFASLFARNFLNLKESNPAFDRLFFAFLFYRISFRHLHQLLLLYLLAFSCLLLALFNGGEVLKSLNSIPWGGCHFPWVGLLFRFINLVSFHLIYSLYMAWKLALHLKGYS